MKELEIRTMEREEQAQEAQDRLTIKRRYEDGRLDYMASTSTPLSTSTSGSSSNTGQEAGKERGREYDY